jgi:hypothetical protein
MARGRSIAGALVLCALAVCVFGVGSASALSQTAVECEEDAGNGTFSDSHCQTAQAGGNYKTVDFPLNEQKELEGTSTSLSGGDQDSILRSKINGVEITVICVKAKGVGKVENVEVSKVMFAKGSAITITYETCRAVPKAEEARNCEVEGITGAPGVGKIKTAALKSTTFNNSMQVKFEPEAGTSLTKFKILTTGEECFFKTAVEVNVTGGVEGESDSTLHSHLTFTEANNGTGLSANGSAAKYIGTYGTYTKVDHNLTVGLLTF